MPLHEIGRMYASFMREGYISRPLHASSTREGCGDACVSAGVWGNARLWRAVSPLHEKQLQPFTNDTPTNITSGILFFRARRTERMPTWDYRIGYRIQ